MDVLDLARELVAIPSPTGEEGEVVAFTARFLERNGWHVTRQPVSPGRDNLYATLDPPAVVLSTHLDVVPPDLPVREDDDWLYGRGACDAKGIAAAMLGAAERMRMHGERRVGLLFVVGEENRSDGALAAAVLEPRGRYLVNGEPTGNRLCVGQKGALRAVLTVQGLAAHSAYPEEGRSAAHVLLDALHRVRALPLPTDPVLGETMLNVGLIRGGIAPNVLAPDAGADLLIRTVAPTEPLRVAIRAAAGPEVKVDFPLDIPSLVSEPLPGWEGITVRFTTDLPLLASWGRGYQLGPGSIRVAHTAGERVAKAELSEAVNLYERLVTQLLNA